MGKHWARKQVAVPYGSWKKYKKAQAEPVHSCSLCEGLHPNVRAEHGERLQKVVDWFKDYHVWKGRDADDTFDRHGDDPDWKDFFDHAEYFQSSYYMGLVEFESEMKERSIRLYEWKNKQRYRANGFRLT